MRTADLAALPIFAGLTDEQLEEMAAVGIAVTIEPGIDLFVEGEHADFWWVLVEGSIDLIRRLGREETVVARMDEPGRWAGGFRAWDEHGVYLATGRGASPGSVLRVPSDAIRSLTTKWFPFGGHLIGGLFNTARSIESTARQRSALVTLGTLAAGLAHEINNPAAAASRAVEGLDHACGTLLSSLGRLAHEEITATEFAALDDLRQELDTRQADLDPLDRADREQELGNWLSRHGVVDVWVIAPALASGGADVGWCDRAGAAVDGSALEPALAWVASTVSAANLLADVKESTRRISELVAAVRSYSQLDRASMQPTDVTDGLDSTLVMLGHKLRDGVEVVRDYADDVPRVDAYPGELNQVWTNLIDNAVDAMEGVGSLRLTTRLDGDDVVVEVADSGPGLTAEVASRAFEAFYTTKDVGRGTGLGLDIAQRIVVERHGGSITIDRAGDETVVRVRLPVSRPD